MNNLVKTVTSRHLSSALRQSIKPVACNVWVRSMGSGGHGYGHEPYRPVMLDDMPVPQGSWQVSYQQKQAKYNRHLILGTTFFLFTVWFITQSGYLFFNFYPPPLPEEEEGSSQ